MGERRKRLGEHLIQAGVLNKEQLSKALELQEAAAKGVGHRRKRLGRILVELGSVTEEQLAAALSAQLDIPQVDLTTIKIPENVLSLVPRETVESDLVVPYALEGKRLLLAMSDPLDIMAQDSIRFRTGFDIRVAVATESSVLQTIEKQYKVEESVEHILRLASDANGVEFVKETEPERESAIALQAESQTAPIIKLVTTIIMDAVKRRTTDIHLEPRESYMQVRYRVDGNLQDVIRLPKGVHASVVSRLKILGNMDIANRMSPQDGSTKMRYENNHVDLRISTLPSILGEKVVIRILDRSKALVTLPKLGVPKALVKSLQEAGSRSQGMIIVTGPTGSGKTTTLYAFLQWLQDPAINIITVEDPVEYSIPGITQVSVREQSGLGFAAFMRSALRQDPDIILVGEVRDLETAEIAVRAALTGHFVLTTLHTNDTVSTVTRLIDLGIPPFLVSSAASGIVAQRLVRRICPDCREEAPFPAEDLPSALPVLPHVFSGRGCPSCDYSGYRGQVGIYEYLEIGSRLKRAIANNAPEAVLREEASKAGMVSLFQDAWDKVAGGITTISEVLGKIPYFEIEPPCLESVTGEPDLTAPPARRPRVETVPDVPARESPQAKTNVIPFPESAMKITRASVLFVGADSEDVGTFRSVLRAQGYRSLTADWPTAYETVRRENPDVILVDLEDDGADWNRLRDQLQSSLMTVTTPVLLVKSDVDCLAEIGGLESGAAGVLRRPLDVNELLARLDRATGAAA